MNSKTTLIAGAFLIALVLATDAPAPAATDLTLAPRLSFTDDSRPSFPIEAKNLDDATVPRSLPNRHLFRYVELLEHGAGGGAAGRSLSAVS